LRHKTGKNVPVYQDDEWEPHQVLAEDFDAFLVFLKELKPREDLEEGDNEE
jgi:hypothetical protein